MYNFASHCHSCIYSNTFDQAIKYCCLFVVNCSRAFIQTKKIFKTTTINQDLFVLFFWFDFVCFLRLMPYQPSWVFLKGQTYPYRRIAVVLFNLQRGNTGVYAFQKVYCLKVNVITWQEFELTFFEASVQHFCHYATRTPHYFFLR